jgi:PBSX family phage terminase large subunit
MEPLQIEYPSFSYESNPIQWKMITDFQHRHLWGVGGIGWGKTAGGVIHDLMLAERYNDVGVVVVPTYVMFEDVQLAEYAKWMAPSIVRGFNATKHRLKLTNGATILFRPAETRRQIERLRGSNIRWVRFEEAALLSKKAYEIMLGRLRVGDWQQAVGSTTPKGKNWVYDLIMQNQTKKEVCTFTIHGRNFQIVRYLGPDFCAYTNIPTFINLKLPDRFLVDLETRYFGKFKEQELFGRFVAMEGLVYDCFKEAKHVLKKPKHKITMTWIVVDWGFTNPAAILVFGIDTEDNLYVIDEIYQSGLTIDKIADFVLEFQDQYSAEATICDKSLPDHIKFLRQKGINANPCNNALISGIDNLYAWISKNMFYVLEHCQNTRNEFGLYSRPEEPKKGKEEEPIKEFDHAMDCCRYMVNWLSDHYGTTKVLGINIFSRKKTPFRY